MRYIQLLPDVTLHDVQGNAVKDENGDPVTMTHAQFIRGRIGDPQFAADLDAVLSAVQIRDAASKALSVVALETADWNRLVAATRKPTHGYHAPIAHCLAPFMRAIVDASETPPKDADK